MKYTNFVLVYIFLSIVLRGYAQKAVQPTIMVIPNEAWCLDMGYSTQFEDPISGQVRELPDYRKAVNDQELILVIAKINEMFADRGFPLKNMQSMLQKIERDRAAQSVIMNRGGDEIAKSPLDELNEAAKADILLKVTWLVNQVGPKRSLTLTIEGVDAYTNKAIGTASGTGPQTFSSEMPILLQESVLSHVENLQAQMSSHFDDLRANGREINLRIMVFQEAYYDLESECNGEAYMDLIFDWLTDNTVGGVFNEGDVTETSMVINDARIPMFDERGRALNARQFGRSLDKYLRSTCKEVQENRIKMISRGLGEIWLILGGR